MAFVNSNLALMSPNYPVTILKSYSYFHDTDTLATIAADDYFLDKYNEMSPGDLILAKGSDSEAWLKVSASASGGVDTEYLNIHLSPGGAAGTGGGLMVMYAITTTSGTGGNYDRVVDKKFIVEYAFLEMRGAGTTSDAVQLKDGSDNIITEQFDVSGLSDNDSKPFTQNYDANSTLNAGESLRVVVTDGGGSDVPAMRIKICGTLAS